MELDQCTRCGEPFDNCVCSDPPPTEGKRSFVFRQWKTMWYLFVISFPTFLFWLVLFVLVSSARAQDCEIGDFGCRHGDYHEWYQKGENGGPIQRPDVGGSCCDGDCRPTKVKFIEDKVYAYIDRQWVFIPNSKIKLIVKPDSMAHICATSSSTIYCLILPDLEN